MTSNALTSTLYVIGEVLTLLLSMDQGASLTSASILNKEGNQLFPLSPFPVGVAGMYAAFVPVPPTPFKVGVVGMRPGGQAFTRVSSVGVDVSDVLVRSRESNGNTTVHTRLSNTTVHARLRPQKCRLFQYLVVTCTCKCTQRHPWLSNMNMYSQLYHFPFHSSRWPIPVPSSPYGRECDTGSNTDQYWRQLYL